ncbi:PhoPQ-activated protein PqaA family protein [Adhaeribacter pallidiroseus]|nr:PhoPQ-activated protein PqaA family protein [Adhaeribacter pallidiroseus]
MKANRLKGLLLLLLVLGTFYGYGQKQPLRIPPSNALLQYVHKPDTSFHWQNNQPSLASNGVFYEVNFQSQTWQSIPWNHKLIVYFPTQAKHPATMLLVLQHLYDQEAGLASLKVISDSTGTPAAMLYDIPNQPLFEGKEEDDLQAYTFSQYLKTGDESWPLLFPMVKSVVRAMDVVQLLAKQQKQLAVTDFIIAGHSKRGHTTWLTAAADKRVKGIIPIAIDILNSKAQLPHHLEAFGAYSTPSQTTTDLLKELQQPRGQRLIQMVDAYSYREQLLIPKLIVSATNDNFFTTDALNLYWPGLKGPKAVLYLSNANHVQADADSRINATAFAFIRAVAAHRSLPPLIWQYRPDNDRIRLEIRTDKRATKAQLWISRAKTKDFRQAVWSSQPITQISRAKGDQGSIYTVEVPRPDSGYTAIFGEVEFIEDGHSFLLSTQTHISSSGR